jgi:TFIIF-interacting CTD phosphatase-like protein
MPILSWYEDRADTKLYELIPVLKLLAQIPDVRPVLLDCCTQENVYQNEKSIQVCERILKQIEEEEKNLKEA